MKAWWRIGTVLLVIAAMLVFASPPASAEPRAHVYLLRGLLNIFSLGMDTLSDELNKRGVYATVHNHTEWQGLADQAAARYKAGTEGPIIIIGHSLGADAAMQMANYLGARGVPVALVVPFDGTQSLAAGAGVVRVLNLTQRQYAYMRRGANFRGTLTNVDVSSDPSIDHLTIDKSPRLHARVIGEVLAVAGNHHITIPGAVTPTQVNAPGGAGAPAAAPGAAAPAVNAPAAPIFPPTPPPVAPAAPAAAPAKTGDGAMNPSLASPVAQTGTPIIAAPERGSHATFAGTLPHKPQTAPMPQAAGAAGQMPD
jgi:hypothetical protein